MKKSEDRSQKSAWTRTLVACLALAAPLAHAGWVIDQDGRYFRMRYAFGASALKQSIFENKILKSDLIVDFAARTVILVDHEKNTVARIGLEEYLKQQQKKQSFRKKDYRPSGSGKYAGLECSKFSYSYNDSAAGTAGGWGGGTGCYTRAVTMPAPYDKLLERWFQVYLDTGTYLGFTLWYESQADGPPRVNLETLSAIEKPVAAGEFAPPAGYRSVAFE